MPYMDEDDPVKPLDKGWLGAVEETVDTRPNPAKQPPAKIVTRKVPVPDAYVGLYTYDSLGSGEYQWSATSVYWSETEVIAELMRIGNAVQVRVVCIPALERWAPGDILKKFTGSSSAVLAYTDGEADNA